MSKKNKHFNNLFFTSKETNSIEKAKAILIWLITKSTNKGFKIITKYKTKGTLFRKNKEYKKIEDFEINFEGDIKFSFNEKTNKIDRYIYLNKQWVLLKR